jgi:hypothetical protein
MGRPDPTDQNVCMKFKYRATVCTRNGESKGAHFRQRRRRPESEPNGGNYQTKQLVLSSQLDVQFVLELTFRFELSVPKGGFSWALQGLAGSS